MKQRFINLLKQVEEKSGNDTACIKFYTDHSGALFVRRNEVFHFASEEELETLLIEYLKN